MRKRTIGKCKGNISRWNIDRHPTIEESVDSLAAQLSCRSLCQGKLTVTHTHTRNCVHGPLPLCSSIPLSRYSHSHSIVTRPRSALCVHQRVELKIRSSEIKSRTTRSPCGGTSLSSCTLLVKCLKLKYFRIRSWFTSRQTCQVP